MRKILTFFLSISSFCVLFSASIPYAGKVSVNGVNFDGQAQFSFSILSPNGSVVWQQGSEANATISVPVENGRYLILLGGQGMNPLPPAFFLEHDNLSLRVRADLSDGEGLRIIGPDQPITSTPHALSAEVARRALVADKVPSGAITRDMLSLSVKQDLNRTVSKSMLGQEVLSDLNRTVTPQMIQSSSITTAQLNEQILKYLKPEITHTPQAPGLIFNGQDITLHSRAEGKYLNYQWHKNGQPIAGATGDRYVIEDINKTQHDGNYSLVVSNDFGTVTTPTTTIDVNGTSTTHTVASISMEMIFCPPGTFMMGQEGVATPVHQVTLTNGFYLGKYEVTQAQYETVMTGNPQGLNAKPSNWPNNNDRPVEKVSWNDIQVFLSRLNDMEQNAGRLPAGWKYVLPTEAQWEYACRAGTTTIFSWGNSATSTQANFKGTHPYGGGASGPNLQQTTDIGQYDPNPWGFFDMHGNVWEWVSDWKANYFTGAQTDPEGPPSGSYRVIRGGSWSSDGAVLPSAKRGIGTPSYRSGDRGFRVGFQKSQ